MNPGPRTESLSSAGGPGYGPRRRRGRRMARPLPRDHASLHALRGATLISRTRSRSAAPCFRVPLAQLGGPVLAHAVHHEGEDPLAVWAPRYYRGGRGRAGRYGTSDKAHSVQPAGPRRRGPPRGGAGPPPSDRRAASALGGATRVQVIDGSVTCALQVHGLARRARRRVLVCSPVRGRTLVTTRPRWRSTSRRGP